MHQQGGIKGMKHLAEEGLGHRVVAHQAQVVAEDGTVGAVGNSASAEDLACGAVDLVLVRLRQQPNVLCICVQGIQLNWTNG